MSLPECRHKKHCNQYKVSGIISPLPDNMTVGMAYVPFQQMVKTYEIDQALQCGTLFPELDKPFMCVKGGRRYE